MSDHHQINYIELPATDIPAMKAFYTAVFGWNYVDYGPSYAAITGAAMDGGFDGNAGARKPSDQGALVVIYSDNIEATEIAVKAAKGEVTAPLFEFPGGRRFHFKDPSGNELAAWTRTAE